MKQIGYLFFEWHQLNRKAEYSFYCFPDNLFMPIKKVEKIFQPNKILSFRKDDIIGAVIYKDDSKNHVKDLIYKVICIEFTPNSSTSAFIGTSKKFKIIAKI